MNNTEKMNLALPAGSDYVDIETLNENFRKIDVHTHTPEEVDAATTFTRIVDVGMDWHGEGGSDPYSSNDAGFYHQTIAVEGILESDNPIVDVVTDIDLDYSNLCLDYLSNIYDIDTFDGEIRLCSRTRISAAFQIQLKVVR